MSVSARNQKLQRVLDIHAEYQRGDFDSIEQVFDALIISMLEPIERRVFEYVIAHPRTQTRLVSEALALSGIHTATVLKGLYDYHLLEREECADGYGRWFVYWRPHANTPA